MLVYLQNLPETRQLVTAFDFPPSASGSALFQSKGCATCHQGKLALETRLHNQNLTDIAVDMWNHQASMKQPAPNLSQEEMRQILGYVWTRQYFRGSGEAVRGKRVFAEKSCATCHNDSAGGAPPLTKSAEGYSDITIISALWEHGPSMLDLMTERKLAWPRFTAPEMADLIAYLNSR
jgi:mono/diheme cytochrome c family protein